MIVSRLSLTLLAEDHMNSFNFLFHSCKISVWIEIYFVFEAAMQCTVKDNHWWVRFEDVDALVKYIPFSAVWTKNYANDVFSKAIVSVQKFESLCFYKMLFSLHRFLLSVIRFSVVGSFCGYILQFSVKSDYYPCRELSRKFWISVFLI